MTDAEIASLILRRRLQLLVHSIIYYRLNESVVSDETWKNWALELEDLQAKYPEIGKGVRYASAFRDFDHSTGYNLPLTDPWAIGRALWVLEIHKRRCKNGDR